MKLWTFQTNLAVAQLQESSILRKPMDQVEGEKWQAAYRWMRQQMEARGISCEGYSPIWAWHSCQKYGKGPTLEDASNLLFAFQLEQGVKVIEFECPNNLALISEYGAWCEVLDSFLDGTKKVVLSKKEEEKLFKLIKKGVQHYQATLPYLKLEWVVDIRDVKLKYGATNFNREEMV